MCCLNPLKHFPIWLHIENWKEKRNAIGNCFPIIFNFGYQQPTSQGLTFPLIIHTFGNLLSTPFSPIFWAVPKPEVTSLISGADWMTLTQPGASWAAWWYLVSKHQSQSQLRRYQARSVARRGKEVQLSEAQSWEKAEGVCKTRVKRSEESLKVWAVLKVSKSSSPSKRGRRYQRLETSQVCNLGSSGFERGCASAQPLNQPWGAPRQKDH